MARDRLVSPLPMQPVLGASSGSLGMASGLPGQAFRQMGSGSLRVSGRLGVPASLLSYFTGQTSPTGHPDPRGEDTDPACSRKECKGLVALFNLRKWYLSPKSYRADRMRWGYALPLPCGDRSASVGEDVGQQERSSPCWQRCKKAQPLWKPFGRFSESQTCTDPASWRLSSEIITPEKWKAETAKPRTPMFAAALFATLPDQKEPRRPSAVENEAISCCFFTPWPSRRREGTNCTRHQ